MNSRQKGKRGELDLAKALRDAGYQTRRGQQYSGTETSADVVGLPGIHIECKRVETFRLYDALEQAKRDTGESGDLPAVFHRKNGELKPGRLRGGCILGRFDHACLGR